MALVLWTRRPAVCPVLGEPPRWRRLRRGDGLRRLRRRRDVWRPILLGGAAVATAAALWWHAGLAVGPLDVGRFPALGGQALARAARPMVARDQWPARATQRGPAQEADPQLDRGSALPTPASPAPTVAEPAIVEPTLPAPTPPAGDDPSPAAPAASEPALMQP